MGTQDCSKVPILNYTMTTTYATTLNGIFTGRES
jgi:hypothetical protein